MKQSDFSIFLEDAILDVRDRLRVKGDEYAKKGDRMHNFETAATVLGSTPERALFGMFVKHLVSIMDMLDGLDDATVPTTNDIVEKFGDAIAYLFLLKAMFMDLKQQKREPFEESGVDHDQNNP